MNVNVSDLKNEIVEYKKLIEEYEENYLNLYNEISSASFFWNDGFSKKFFDEKNKEKLKESTTLSELNAIKDIYNYLIEQYQQLGDKISFNLNEKDSIINKYNDVISKLKEIKNSYNRLNISFCPYEARIIRNQIYKVENNINIIIDSKERIINILNKIENIEKEVNYRKSKLTIEIIKETEIRTNVLNKATESLIDEVVINNTIEKLKMYRSSENLNYDKILNRIRSMNINYNTSNTESLNNTLFEIENKFRIINLNHNNNINIINNKLTDYITTRKKVENMFKNIV